MVFERWSTRQNIRVQRKAFRAIKLLAYLRGLALLRIYVRRTTGFFTNSWRIKIALESYFEEHAQDVWARNWMNLEVQTTLLNTYHSKKVINCIQSRRLLDQYQKSLLSMIKSWKEDENSGATSTVGICPKILCWLRDVKKLGTFWRCLRDCSNARVQRCGHETVGPNLGGHRQVCGSDTQENSIEVVGKRIQNEEARSDSTSSTSFSIVLCNATSRSGEGPCLNHDVGEFVKQKETIEFETLRHQQSTFPRNSPETHLHQSSRRGSSEVWRGQGWQIDQQHIRNPRRFPHLATWLCEPNPRRVGRLPKRQTQRSIVSLSEAGCENGSAIVCLSDDHGLEAHRQSSKIQMDGERHGNTWIRRFRREKAFYCWIVYSELELIKLDKSWILNLIWDTLHSSSVNRDAIPTPKQWAHHERNCMANWCSTEDGVRFWRKMKQHDTDLLVRDFHTYPKTDRIWLKQRNTWPRDWASLLQLTLHRGNVQHGIRWESPKQRWYF